MDFLDFEFPPDPSVLYLFNPSSASVLARLLNNVRRSLEQSPRPIYIAYVAPEHAQLLDPGWSQLVVESRDYRFRLYAAGPA